MISGSSDLPLAAPNGQGGPSPLESIEAERVETNLRAENTRKFVDSEVEEAGETGAPGTVNK